MTDYILEARDLKYEYPASAQALECFGMRPQALMGANLTVKRGSRVAILGGNGAGKSTLTMHFNGMFRPTSGQLFLNGEPADYSRKAGLVWRQKVGMVFQDPDDQIFSATVFQDVSFGPVNLGLPDDEVLRRVSESLEDMDIRFLADTPTHMISFGQKKRVAIAGVVAMRPEALVLDEPTAGLDPSGVKQLLNILSRLQQRGTTIIITTHDVDLAYAWADDVAIMMDGVVLRQGDPYEVMGDQSLMSSAKLRQPWALAMGQVLEEKFGIDLGESHPRSFRRLLEAMKNGGVKPQA